MAEDRSPADPANGEEEEGEQSAEDAELDEAIEETFPASDAPATWSGPHLS